jgi:hypothetical protein
MTLAACHVLPVALRISAGSAPPPPATTTRRDRAQSASPKNVVQALLTLFDQLSGGCDDFFGQELEQLVLIGEADGLQYTLLYEEIFEHRPVFPFLLKDRDKGDFIQVHTCSDLLGHGGATQIHADEASEAVFALFSLSCKTDASNVSLSMLSRNSMTRGASAAAADAAGMSDLATLPILRDDNAQPTYEPSAGRRLRFR